MIEALFLAIALILAYIFLGYPLLLWLLSLFYRPRLKKGRAEPSVTMIISARDEEKVIAAKLRNTLELDYPVQVIVASDGSKDRTESIVRSFGIRLHRTARPMGKNRAINSCMPLAEGEIIVFSDANSMYAKDAVRRLVSHFSDRRIGLVCGELCYSGGEEGLYWRYEQLLRRLEGRLGALLTANGSIFAMRKRLFRQLLPTVANDFQSPQDAATQGFYCIYEPEARASELPAISIRSEYKRKVRIVARGLEGALRLSFSGMRLFELLSHKLLRWLLPFFLIAFFILNALLLDIVLYRAVFSVQLLFLAASALGLMGIRAFRLPAYFIAVNAAALHGFFRFALRKPITSWSNPRKSA